MKRKSLRPASAARFLLKLTAAVVLIFVLFILVEHVRGRRAYHSLLEEMRANGEETDVHKLAPTKPDDSENMAARLGELYESLSILEESRGGAPPFMKLVTPGIARPTWSVAEWEQTVTVTDTNGFPIYEKRKVDWEDVASTSTSNPLDDEQIQDILALPRFHSGLTYEDFNSADAYAFVSSKVFGKMLVRRARLAEWEQRTNDSIKNQLFLLKLVHAMDDEPILITQLIRQALGFMAFDTAWNTLARHSMTTELTESLIKAWNEVHFAPSVCRSLRVERAVNITFVERLRSSRETRLDTFRDHEGVPDDFHYPLPTSGIALKMIHIPLWRAAWIDQDATRAIREWNENILDADSILDGSKSPSQRYEGREPPDIISFFTEQGEVSLGSFYDRSRFLYSNLGVPLNDTVIVRTAKVETMKSLIMSPLALELHRLKYGDHPEALDDLVPEILEEVPRDFMDGTRMKYRRIANDEFLLYSSGVDGVDDGGDPSWAEGAEPGANIWAGQDAVWPKVAD